ncbi:unnamed protein product [Prunus armeniaca]|uniref:Uncharacterized protein n=1 Tax=Prunus armeniaca TaxID=36596 RepID=A0A6J5VE98_PRUAR|nr:unnamed protein product [Prunus armeniaca]
MTSQVGRVIHDQNLNAQSNGASVVGKTDTVKTQRKGGLGGKKSLGDLSNSGKPAFNQASKKQPSNNFPVVEEVTSLPKIVHDASTRKGVFKASEKVQTHSRNTLSHISNSVKPNLQKNHSMKLKPESPLRCKKLEEMSENLDPPPPVFESPKYYTAYEDFDELSDKFDYPPIDYTDFPWISEDCDFKLMSPNH